MAIERKPDFERYMTALHCEEPDRVPLGDWHVDTLSKEGFLGKKVETLADQLEFWRAAGFDYVTSSSGILEPVQAPEGMTIEGDEVRTQYGTRKREWAHEHDGTITNWEQFEKYPFPTADEFDLSKWDFFDKNLPSGMKAVLLLGKVYTTVWMYMGAERFFNALEGDKELITALFDKVGSTQYETLLRVIEHPCVGAVVNPDDIAHNTGLLVHPKYLRQYVFPWYKKMADACRDKGVGFILHSDGNCMEMMDDIVECGFQGFHPIQPNAMDIVEVKKRWGDKLCLQGNINLDSTLTLGAPEDVRAEVYERIRTIGPGGGYMVASSNSVTDYVPIPNMKAMFDATFEFGKYPIELEEGGVKGKVWSYQAREKTEEAEVATEMDVAAYTTALLSSKAAPVIELVEKDITKGLEAAKVVNMGLIPAMAKVGEKFQEGEIYIPEMMLAAKAMSETLKHFQDRIVMKAEEKLGTVVIGTVQGDMHDIGKNLVAMMLEGQGFTVVDLGVSVTPDRFVKAVKENKPEVLALSALLTTTMVEMENTIDALSKAGLRDEISVIVGGAPVTKGFADKIGADGWAYDAPGAARICKTLVS